MGLVRALLRRDRDEMVERGFEPDTGRLRVTITGADRTSQEFNPVFAEMIAEANAIVADMDDDLADLREFVATATGGVTYGADPEETLGLRRTITDTVTGETAHLRIGRFGEVVVVIRSGDERMARLHHTDLSVQTSANSPRRKHPGIRVVTKNSARTTENTTRP